MGLVTLLTGPGHGGVCLLSQQLVGGSWQMVSFESFGTGQQGETGMLHFGSPSWCINQRWKPEGAADILGQQARCSWLSLSFKTQPLIWGSTHPN